LGTATTICCCKVKLFLFQTIFATTSDIDASL